MDRGAPLVLGRYELHGLIARGGMATVHFGRVRGAEGFARAVAIKRLHPQLATNDVFRATFVDEGRLVARIRHPNVVQILDVVSEGDELFLVMEYVHGESLDGLIHRPEAAPIPAPIAAAIFVDALHGLQAAHEATTADGVPLGIVHRDITPHNVLVGTGGDARITDFGIAKASARQQWTKEGQLKGKLSYLAPEQFEGEATAAVDIYAAAVSLHEALTGHVLFDGDHEAVVMTKIMLGASAPPSTFVPSIPTALDDIVMCGLEMKPNKRFKTAREMALALEEAIVRPHASEIAAWLGTRAQASLAARAELLAAMDRVPMIDVPVHLESPAEAMPAATSDAGLPRRRSRALTGTIAASLLAVVILLSVWTVQRESEAERAARSVLAMPTATTSYAAAPVVAPEPTSGGDAPIEIPNTPASASARAPGRASARPPPAPVRLAPRAPDVDACNPPYVRDANGGKVYKRQCL